MLDSAKVPPVSPDETLARFIIFSKHFRSSNNTVKPDAFIPHPQTELSVTRHRQATNDEIWQEGERVAALRSTTLYGRADVTAAVFTDEELSVVPKPIIPENPNHADVIDWPAEKPAQKMKAVDIASKAQYLSRPASPDADKALNQG
jgi:hypothetical protein